jgi:hypothetical protein
MKRFLSAAVVSLAVYGFAANQSSAGWLHHCECTQQYTVTVTCRQYNAFSPFCCDQGSVKTHHCLHGHCGHGGCCAQAYSPENGCDSCLGELPAVEPHGAATGFQNGMHDIPAQMPSAPPNQGWSGWGPGMMNPETQSFNFPMNQGFAPAGIAGR